LPSPFLVKEKAVCGGFVGFQRSAKLRA
jgi:hypothetical protein